MLGTAGMLILGIVVLPPVPYCCDQVAYGAEVEVEQGRPSITTLALGLANAFQQPETSAKWLQELLQRARAADDAKFWGKLVPEKPMQLPLRPSPPIGGEGEVVLKLGFERQADGTLASDVSKIQYRDRIISLDEVPGLLEAEKQAIQKKLGPKAKPRLLLKVDGQVRSGEIHKLTRFADAAGFKLSVLSLVEVTIEIPAASEKGPRFDSGSVPAD